MSHDIVTIGGAVEDITFYTPEARIIDNEQEVLCQRLIAFEYGAKMRVNAVKSTFGGGAANVAVGCARLGLRAACMCVVGNDERGERIIHNLANQKVDTSYIQTYHKEPSTFSFVIVGPGHEHTIFSYNGAKSHLKITKASMQKLATKWIYVTSLSGKWRDGLRAIFTHPDRYRIAWNPGHVQLTEGAALVRRYLRHTGVVILNKDEAAELVASDAAIMKDKKKNAAYLNNVKNLLKALHSYGVSIAVITNGKKGADAYDGTAFYHADILSDKKRMDTTGIGDAFGAGFVSGLWAYGNDIDRSLQLAMHNAASVITKHGAQNGLLRKKLKRRA